MVNTPLSQSWIEQIESNQDIYIAIPSFNEQFLFDTIDSIYSNAQNPNSIHVGICNQRTDGVFEDFSKFLNVKSLNIHYPYARGLGLAMLEAMMMWSGQKYFMRLDAHSIMKENWDSDLIEAFSELRNICDKPIISQRTDWFAVGKTGTKIFVDGHVDPRYSQEQIVGVIKNQESSYSENPIPWPDGVPYIEHFIVNGGYMFSDWKFFDELLSDPRISFFGEEHVFGVRAASKGFRIFGIDKQVLYTLGKSTDFADTELGKQDWRNFVDSKPNSFLHFYYSYKNILAGIDGGYFGVSDNESYKKYMDNIGFDYAKFYSENGFLNGL